MSKAELFSELTNLVDIDPFALLGVSVSADEKRIAKRYRQIAKALHPDAIAGLSSQGMEQILAAEVIARIVNPSYQKLKQEKGRQETLATLRFRVRRLARTEKLVPTFAHAQQLSTTEESAVDVSYEQALSHLAEKQFLSLENLHSTALEVGQLNLVFLHRKLEIAVIRPKRAGLITNAVMPTAAIAASKASAAEPADNAPEPAEEEPEIDYARKHVIRAKTYLSQPNYEAAVQELREALKIAPRSAEIHSMIGQAYYKQKLSGMAKAHFKQALKLKPSHKVAQKYGELLGLSSVDRSSQSASSEEKKPWLGRLLHR